MGYQKRYNFEKAIRNKTEWSIAFEPEVKNAVTVNCFPIFCHHTVAEVFEVLNQAHESWVKIPELIHAFSLPLIPKTLKSFAKLPWHRALSACNAQLSANFYDIFVKIQNF